MVAELLAVLLALPVYMGDGESGESREARLDPWARAIAAEARTPDEAAALVAVGQLESRWAEYVTEGRCHEGPAGQRCDNGRAKGPYQLHGWCTATDPRGQTACAARMLRWARSRCGSWERAFGAYASGGRCYAMPEREALRVRVLAGLSGGKR